MKKIYSLNLMAFITMETRIVPTFYKQEKLIYALFPELPEVEEAINSYRDSNTTVNLHNYLAQFKKLRQLIKEV